MVIDMRNLCLDPSRSFDKPHASRIAMSAAFSSECLSVHRRVKATNSSIEVSAGSLTAPVAG
jgi:hypothetical protein